MTVAVAQSASQAAAGAPIILNDSFTSTDAFGDSFPAMRIGVTTTSATPTVLSDLAHTDAAGPEAALWDSVSQTETDGWGASVVTQSVYSRRCQLIKRLDSNYVAGRYLWFVGFASGSPSAGDAVTAVSRSYLIR